MAKKPSEYAYRHKPQGYMAYSLSVLKDNGYLEIYMDAANYGKENDDQDGEYEEILKGRLDRGEIFSRIEINPANISSIQYPDDCHLYAGQSGDHDWEKSRISKLNGKDHFLDVAIVTMNNGYRYMFPAEEKAMHKALTISLQIIRGTYVPEVKPIKAAAKKSTPKAKPIGAPAP